VLVAWIASLLALTAIHSAAGSAYTDNFKLPSTESFDAVALLQRNAPKASGDTDQIVIAVKQGRVTDPAVRAQVEQVLTVAAQQPHVSLISSPYGPRGASQIAPSGRVAFANVTFDLQSNKIQDAAAKAFVAKITSSSGRGVEFEVEGQIARAGSRSNGSASLGIGFIAAAVVLFLVFGSLLATLLPLLAAGLSLGAGIAVIGLFSHVMDMASFSNQLALLIGLGVGVDYALFIVTRYRQGLLRGLSGEEATLQSLDTLRPRGAVRRADRVHRDARHVRPRGQLFVRRRGGGGDRRGVHRDLGADAAPGDARLLRAPRAAPPRAGGGARRPAADVRRVLGMEALERADGASSGRLRGRRRGSHGRDRDPVLLDAARVLRRRQRPGQHDHAQGLRSARQGLRARLQRPAAAHRPDQHARSARGIRPRRASGRGHARGRRLDATEAHRRRRRAP
jgi:hypothetical protein